jgi:hypothetical protein
MEGETSSGQHVLMKDQSKIKKAVRHTTIVINSRDRNFLTYPNPNNFRYTLRRALTNVMSIELMNGSFPGYIYNVDIGWNKFNFQEGTTIYTVTLTPGLYTEVNLAAELQIQLNAIIGISNSYTVSVISTTLIMSVVRATGTASFGFLFSSGAYKDEIDYNTLAILSINTPARAFGFGLNDYFDNAGTLSGLLPMDVQNFLNKVYLHLESDGKNLARMEVGAGRQDCYHILYINPGEKNYIFLDKETDHSIFVSSPSPLARVTTIEMSVRDEFNRRVNLNHRDFSLVFEITHLE